MLCKVTANKLQKKCTLRWSKMKLLPLSDFQTLLMADEHDAFQTQMRVFKIHEGSYR